MVTGDAQDKTELYEGCRDCPLVHLLHLTGVDLTDEGRLLRKGAGATQPSGNSSRPWLMTLNRHFMPQNCCWIFTQDGFG